jgi:hypothetical protein
VRLIGLRVRPDDERGVVAVIVALLLVVLGGSAAVMFDLARLRHERHVIQTAVDLGSLAGAGMLPASDPVTAAAAEAAARDVAVSNAPQLASGGLSIAFWCAVKDPEGNGGQDSDDLGFACGDQSWTSGWAAPKSGRSFHPCNPYAGDQCNTIVLTASSTIDYFFAPLIGFDTGNTGALTGAACNGYCGQAASPLDVVFVIDRSTSMSSQNMADLKAAIANPDPAENSVLEFYDEDDVHVGLVALPYKDPANPYRMNPQQDYPEPDPDPWQVVGLSNDYRQAGGNLNMGSALVDHIVNMQQGSTAVFVDGNRSRSGHTNHGDPLAAAQAMLATGRPEAPDVIIFFADGEANQPQAYTAGGAVVQNRYNPCDYALTRALDARNAGATIFSLAYGATGARCGFDHSASGFQGAWATTFLAAVASPTSAGDATDNLPGACALDENVDLDNYFCETRGDDQGLEDAFRQIAIQSLTRSKLINF